MVQLDLQSPSNLTETRGFIPKKLTDTGHFFPNLQKPVAPSQEQTNKMLKADASNVIDLSSDSLKIHNVLGIGHLANEHKIFNANESKNYKPNISPIVVPLREWEGYVVEIAGDTFIAKLIDVKNNSKLPKESGKFTLNMLSLEDQNELQLGSRIRWKIYLEILSSGQPQNVSKVALIDTPEITEEVIENAYKYSAETTKRLKEIEAST